jgi:hypothetical protein
MNFTAHRNAEDNLQILLKGKEMEVFYRTHVTEVVEPLINTSNIPSKADLEVKNQRVLEKRLTFFPAHGAYVLILLLNTNSYMWGPYDMGRRATRKFLKNKILEGLRRFV